MTKLNISMASTTEAVPETIECIARFSAGVGLNHDAAQQIKIVMAEALSNIITYALMFDKSERIAITCLADNERLEIKVRDKGRPLKTSKVYGCPKPSNPCLDGCTQCGRGWPIIMRWADGVEYVRQPGHNDLTLYKKIS